MTSLDDLLARDAVAWRADVDRRLAAGADVMLDRTGRMHRRTFVAVWLSAAAVVLLALTIGVVAIRGGFGANGIEAGATDPVHPSIPPGYSVGVAPAPHQLSEAQAEKLTSMPWKLDAVDDAANTIEIRYVVGDLCMTKRGVYVAESATSVLVAVLSKDHSPDSCADALVTGKYSIHLRTALGHRTLRHATVDGGWSHPDFLDG